MNLTLLGILFSLSLFLGILTLIILGRRIGLRRVRLEGEDAEKGFSALTGAVFGLMGLVLTFTFSGALERFNARRHLVVEETNDIGTAWLRVSLLPAPAQPAMRDLFRRYTDLRISTYAKLPDVAAARAEAAKSTEVQGEIWKLAVSSLQDGAPSAAPMLVLPALNAMFDIATTQSEATRLHPPAVIFAMLGVLTLACSLFAGYDMASRQHINHFHSVAFALVLSVTVYVILDLEYPRLGLIRMSDSDQALVDLRQTMN